MINITMHTTTPAQESAGVFDADGNDRANILALLDFSEIPTPEEIGDRVSRIMSIVAKYNPKAAMIGGAFWLLPPLAAALKENGITPFYAFSKRESVDSLQNDGSIKKSVTFRHAGFVPA